MARTYFLSLGPLGKYNPLYRLGVERLHLTFLRGPVKFLFFTTLSLGILAGFGFDKIFQSTQKELIHKLQKIFLGLTVFFVCLAFWFSALFLNKQKNSGFIMVEAMPKKIFFEKTDRFKDLPLYYDMIHEKLSKIGRLFSYSNPWNWCVIGMLIVSLGCYGWFCGVDVVHG